MDDESFSERIGPLPPDVDAMFRCTLTRSSGEPEELAAGYGVGYFHLVWDRSSGLSRGIVGGPSTMIERLASMAPEIRCGARATLVEESGDGVRVRYEDGGGEHVVTAAAAVLAVPAPVAAALAPGLPGETAAALREVHYGQYAVGAFLVEGKAPLPWDGLYAVATPGPLVRHGLQHRQRAAAARRAATGARHVMVYAAADLGARLLQEDDETIARRFRDDLCAVFPEVTRRIEDVVVQRWPRGIPFAHVGRGRLQAPLTRPLGRLHLVGDYLGTRYVETCAENAEAAALRIREQLPLRAADEPLGYIGRPLSRPIASQADSSLATIRNRVCGRSSWKVLPTRSF